MTPYFPIELKKDHDHDHDLNQQHHQQFFVFDQSQSAAASPGFYDQRGYYYHREQSHHHLLHHQQQEAKVVYDASQAGGSCDHNQTVVRNESENMSSGLKFTILKKEDRNIHHENDNSAAKWMSSKMRLMKKMMNSEVGGGSAPTDHISNNNPTPKFDIEDHNKQFFSSSTSETENSFNIINNNTNTIRVCSDCNTTKTPLWRSGPRGPKSLCNACGIRKKEMGMRRKLCFTLLVLSVIVLSASLALANTLELDKDPELKSCRRQCKEEFKDRQKKLCLQKCEDDYRQKRREKQNRECQVKCGEMYDEGGQQWHVCRMTCQNNYMNEISEPGSDQGQEWEGRQQEEEEEEEDENPYVFEFHHFLSKVKTEHGRILSIPKFDRRSKLLRGIRRYRVAILQVNPETVLTPTHLDATSVFFVSSGQGTINVIHEDRRDSFKLEKGVLLRLHAGTTFSIVNHRQRDKLNIIQLLRPVNNAGQFEPFFLAAGSNPESFFTTFSSEILEAAFKTSKGELQRLFSRREQGQGVFVKASKEQIRALSDSEKSGGIWPFGSQSRGTYRLFKQPPTQGNNFGQLYEVDRKVYPPLEDEDLSISYANISQDAMMGPYYNTEATKIAVVTDGDGYFEMACPHVSKSSDDEQQQQEGRSGVTYHKIRSAIKTGSVFIVPAGHPMVTVASNRDNLEIVCFEVNAKHNVRYMLAGKKNVVTKMERDEKELTFDAKREEVDRVFGKQDEELFFQGPRQQPGQGRAYE